MAGNTVKDPLRCRRGIRERPGEELTPRDEHAHWSAEGLGFLANQSTGTTSGTRFPAKYPSACEKTAAVVVSPFVAREATHHEGKRCLIPGGPSPAL